MKLLRVFLVTLFLPACFCAFISCSSKSPSSGTERSSHNPQTATNSPRTTQPTFDFTAIDQILERAAPQLGGAALLLIHDDKVIYRKSFGGHEPDKVLPVASASKWLSGAVMMTLVDEGKISLDDPVAKYLPEFGDDKSQITIRHLFAHTSGLPPESRCRNDKRTTLERCVSAMSRLPLTSTPGEEFFYGGVSMHVGGRIAEVVTGKSWNEVFLERIASPLGMDHTDFFAYGPTDNPRPAGDARSSVDDYGRFLQMILKRGTFNGNRILSLDSLGQMHRDQTGGARIVYTIYEKHGSRDPTLLLARYGIGVWRERVDETNNLREASSQGALGFSPWIDVERNLAGVLSVRSTFSRGIPLYLELKEEIRRIVPVSDEPLGRHLK